MGVHRLFCALCCLSMWRKVSSGAWRCDCQPQNKLKSWESAIFFFRCLTLFRILGLQVSHLIILSRDIQGKDEFALLQTAGESPCTAPSQRDLFCSLSCLVLTQAQPQMLLKPEETVM